MGAKGSAPPPPDPTATANAQAGYDKSTANYNAQLNRFDVNTPLGSQTWTQGAPTRTFNQQRYDDAVKTAQNATFMNGVGGGDTGGSGWGLGGSGSAPTPSNAAMPDRNADQFYDMTPSTQWSQQIALTPDAQTALDNSQKTQAGLSGLQGQALTGVAGTLNSNPFDKSALPAAPINAGQTAQDAIMSRLQPQMDNENKQFAAQMANQGIPVGSEGYDAAHRQLAQQQNDMMLQAATQGIGVGQQARQQAIQEQGYYANAPLNYLNGLMTGSQVQTPQFQGTPAVTANSPNYQQAVANQYQGQLNSYNADTASSNSMTSGLMSVAAAAAMAF